MNATPSACLDLRVVPNGSRAQIVGWLGSALKVKVMAPPEGGRANQEVIAVLARSLQVSERQVVIESGTTARNKRVRISGLSEAEVQARLRLETDGPVRP